MEREYKLEKILEVGCEGFGADYFRITYSDGLARFARQASSSFDWNELDMDESEFHKVYSSFVLFDSFEDLWKECTNCNGWYLLGYSNIHDDYKNFIVGEVIASRNRVRASVRNITHDDVENILKQKQRNKRLLKTKRNSSESLFA